MRVIEPRAQVSERRLRRRAWRLVNVLVVFILIIFVAFGSYAYSRPLPRLSGSSGTQVVPGQTVKLAWPNYGQSAVGAEGYGVLASSGSTSPLPMASITKVITALAVLHQYPLTLGQQGPELTLTANDVALYQRYVAQGGSVVPVVAGEQISEYQALQAMLLPSANNMADSLATWVYGSLATYLTSANNLIKGFGLAHTAVADASGFSPSSVSTAHDLVLLGETAMQNSVLAEIVGQSQADIPTAGTVKNVNTLLGQSGIVGVKTGNTDQAGGCFLFAANQSYPGGHTVTIVGAIMGASSLGMAFDSALPLLTSTQNGFGMTTVARAGQSIATYTIPWGGSISAVAAKDLTVFGWRGSQYRLSRGLLSISAPAQTASAAGTIGVQTPSGRYSVPVVLGQSLNKPSRIWRVERIFHPSTNR